MMMKTKLILVVGALWMLFGYSYANTEKESDTKEKTLYELVTKQAKKGDGFNLYLNMQTEFSLGWNDGNFEEGKFNFRQLRIEAKGNITPWLSYRWRQRLTKGNPNEAVIDNLPNSIDWAGIGVKLSPSWHVFIGKQSTTYGGFEFDANPIEIYQFSDMIDYMSNFMTGVNFMYYPTPDHQLCLQIQNSTTRTFEGTYGFDPETEPENSINGGIKLSKIPLVYTLNWNGNFMDNMLLTRWSASVLQEAQKEFMYYFALGTQLNINRVSTYFDFMYSREDIDRKGIVTDIVNMGLPTGSAYFRAMDAKYMSLVWKFNYRLTPKWNLFVKGMYETQGLGKDNGSIMEGRYRTSWGYLGGVEYYPMKSNLHFFLTFVGRSYVYTEEARAFGLDNYDTQRVSLGFIYQLPMY